MKKIITCESVFRGHPDKVCDQISDAILDACLEQDKNSRVAIECAIIDDMVWLFGEISTTAKVDYTRVAKKVLREVGYEGEFYILEKISKQSNDIALGVDKDGAGDQGVMFGYAEDNNSNFMPYPLMLAHEISRKMEFLRKEKYPHIFGSDGKCQVSAIYDNDSFIAIDTIVVSIQTKENVLLKIIEPIIVNEVLNTLGICLESTKILINPTGAFVVGGSYADSGLTGRKIIVDTYGGVARHGGGAFSGKDPSKVDRSGALYCRYIAKAIVKAQLAKKCEVNVAYSIGIAEPVSISVNSFGTGNDEYILKLIKENFDFRPANIKKELNLLNIKYYPLACYGAFGRNEYPWEQVDEKAKILQAQKT